MLWYNDLIACLVGGAIEEAMLSVCAFKNSNEVEGRRKRCKDESAGMAAVVPVPADQINGNGERRVPSVTSQLRGYFLD